MQIEFPELAASEAAVEAANGVESARFSLVKWLRPNDTKATRNHQAGYHVPIVSWPMFFERPGQNDENLERDIVIDWYGYGTTDSKWKWYGEKTRHEYRLTSFGRGFPHREPESVGSLFVIHSTSDSDRYCAFVFEADDEIEDFLSLAGLTPSDVGQLLTRDLAPDECLDHETSRALAVHGDFPPTAQMAELARAIAELCLKLTTADPDKAIKGFTDVEYRLFRTFEARAFAEEKDREPIDTIERLIKLGNSFANRRKSRAGKSLEHHVAACLDAARLPYDPQAKTEGKRTMDFMFPSQAAYHDVAYSAARLVPLAAKTSTKERWAQVLNEADRCPDKFLLTTQPATMDTIDEMATQRLRLVVPKPYLNNFPKGAGQKVLTVTEFFDHVRHTIRLS